MDLVLVAQSPLGPYWPLLRVAYMYGVLTESSGVSHSGKTQRAGEGAHFGTPQ